MNLIPRQRTGRQIRSRSDIIKKLNPEAKVITGGAHPSSIPKKCKEDGFDTVVVGEGEKAIVNIVRKYEKSEGFYPDRNADCHLSHQYHWFYFD